MSAWDKMQQTIDELRAELNSVLATIAKSDGALAERAARAHKYTSANGAVELNCAAGAIKLAGVSGVVEEQASLCIDPGQQVEPLRMGKVTFYGESARQIRAAQEVLRAAGAGQLEVVKRANGPGDPYVVVDGQVFINQAAIDDQVGAVRLWKKQVNLQGKHFAAGIVQGAELKPLDDFLKETAAIIGPLKCKITDPADQIRQVIRDELKPGGMLHRG